MIMIEPIVCSASSEHRISNNMVMNINYYSEYYRKKMFSDIFMAISELKIVCEIVYKK